MQTQFGFSSFFDDMLWILWQNKIAPVVIQYKLSVGKMFFSTAVINNNSQLSQTTYPIWKLEAQRQWPLKSISLNFKLMVAK